MSAAPKIRAAILISGRGSNMSALIEAAKDSNYAVEIVLVLSNVKDAPGLKLAQAAGIETVVVEHQPFGKDKAAFEQALQNELEQKDIQLICLAGFMRVLSGGFLKQWTNRIVNIHPSLLPAYKGLDTHQRVLDAKEKLHGCSVHYVTEEVDGGQLIAQMRVAVQDNDTAETLAARVLQAEHKLYPKALLLVADRILRSPLQTKKRA
ncbi:MAG: phosphoribosylglycinamide formyltransferase [Pseudomonadota bacterium]